MVFLREGCSVCGKCAVNCPSLALSLCGEEKTVDELFTEIQKDTHYFIASGGGVTFSGGEPLSQAEFLLQIIPILKSRGVHLAIETSGYADMETYRSVIAEMDFVYQDLKLLDEVEFRRWTGGDLKIVLDNISWLRKSGVPFVFRVPLIPGVNDSESSGGKFRAFAGNDMIEYLPYNNAAGVKYRMLGREYALKEVVS
jgi:pyruvate formate lyase activating enzyme